MSRAVFSPPQRFAIRPDTLAASVVVMLSMTLVQRCVGFVRSLLFCRWLSAGELGQWDLIFSFIELAAPIAVLSLPAAFARYVEHYRVRGQLRTFLGRMGLAVLLLVTLSTTAAFTLGQQPIMRLLEIQPSHVRLVRLLLLALPAVILYYAVGELFSALRMYRVVSMLNFAQSLLFATLGVLLVLGWHAGADAAVLSYGAASVLCTAPLLYWLLRMWRRLPQAAVPLPQTQFWAKLLPFVGAVWISNWVGNVFMMIDRYMILHFSRLDPPDALAIVGQYHSARVVPILLISVASLLSTMVVPFLSHDWENGRRDLVALRVNSLVKWIGLGLMGLAVAVLAVAPVLFGQVFAGKFAAGLSVLPFTLACAVWLCMFNGVKTYLWCAEQVWLVSMAFVAGIAANVGLNLVLLPRYPLGGAVAAATCGTLVAVLAAMAFVQRQGMRVGLGTWIVATLPAALWLGPWPAAAILAAVLALAGGSGLVFTVSEKDDFRKALRAHWHHLLRRWVRLRRSATRRAAPPPAQLEWEETNVGG